MGTIRFNDKTLTVQAQETVLDTLLANGNEVPNSCRAGACQSCLMQSTSGTIPAQAQIGLKDTLRAQGYFLACRCQPEGDLAVRLPVPEDVRTGATVSGLERLAEHVLRLRLKPDTPFHYRAGQYVTLWRNQTIGRSYSLASVPECDEELEFHIRIIPGGRFSAWASDELRLGDRLMIQSPSGNCFYVPGSKHKELLLIGTGTGLAPLYGILRNALRVGHQANIQLFHGAMDPSGLYLADEIQALAHKHTNFHYHPTVLETNGTAPTGVQVGSIEDFALSTVPNLTGSKVYVCGDPAFVNRLRKRIFLAGASMGDIYVDAFLPPADGKQAA